jgi:hypothetical protein
LFEITPGVIVIYRIGFERTFIIRFDLFKKSNGFGVVLLVVILNGLLVFKTQVGLFRSFSYFEQETARSARTGTARIICLL